MDLTSTYLGLTLTNPLIASSSPLNLDVDNIMRLEDHGAAAVVLPSMFEEQLEEEAAEIERLTTAGSNSFAEALSFFAPTASYRTGPHNYLETIRRAREAVDIPVIASLNGITDAGWANFARLIEEAGASAIELNVFFVPADPSLSGPTVEQRYVDVLRAVRKSVNIPIAMKLSPYFSAIGHFIRELDQEGADGFVLFNRFYEPDIDLMTLRLRRDLELSTPS
jgi:dihydroorotate dehydrogenase (fumarate)